MEGLTPHTLLPYRIPGALNERRPTKPPSGRGTKEHTTSPGCSQVDFSTRTRSWSPAYWCTYSTLEGRGRRDLVSKGNPVAAVCYVRLAMADHHHQHFRVPPLLRSSSVIKSLAVKRQSSCSSGWRCESFLGLHESNSGTSSRRTAS